MENSMEYTARQEGIDDVEEASQALSLADHIDYLSATTDIGAGPPRDDYMYDMFPSGRRRIRNAVKKYITTITQAEEMNLSGLARALRRVLLSSVERRFFNDIDKVYNRR